MEEENFTREDTKAVKGVAVLMMLMHHLFSYPDRIAYPGLITLSSYIGFDLIKYIGLFGQSCVSIFTLIGGYGIYRNFQSGKLSVKTKIKQLYFEYWKVFAVFVPIGFLFFSDQPQYCKSETVCNRFSDFSITDLFLNVIGVKSSYNNEWWFLITYVFCLLLFPLISKIISKCSFKLNVILIVILSFISIFSTRTLYGITINDYMLINNPFYYSILIQTPPYLCVFVTGCLLAKEDLVNKFLKSANKKSRISLCLSPLIIIAAFWARLKWGIAEFDSLFVSIMMIGIILLLKSAPKTSRLFSKVGRYSTTIWLTHSFFCYYFYVFAKFIILPRFSVPVFLLLALITYAFSVFFEKLFKKMRISFKIDQFLKSNLSYYNRARNKRADK